MSKDNHIDYVELPASSIDELNKTKEFFGKVFGWSFQQWGDDYVDTKDSGVSSGINAGNPPLAPLPVIYAKDIQAAYDKIRAADGTNTKETFSFPGGQRFHFKDPAGNELAVWSK